MACCAASPGKADMHGHCHRRRYAYRLTVCLRLDLQQLRSGAPHRAFAKWVEPNRIWVLWHGWLFESRLQSVFFGQKGHFAADHSNRLRHVGRFRLLDRTGPSLARDDLGQHAANGLFAGRRHRLKMLA
jgi:hypothetical protein